MQDELCGLEEELAKLDTIYSRRDCEDLSNGTFRDDQVDDRRILVAKIAKSLREYNEFVLQQSTEEIFTPAEEQKYLDHEEDLLCVVQRDKTTLRRLIDKSHLVRTLSIWKNKTKTPTETDAQHVPYYSDKRIDTFASGIIVAILQAMKILRIKLAVITIFVFAFLLLLSFSMASKPFEALSATAA
ncbi:hypothetical protein EDB81DRAFT_905875 [Dactylonectria macrodidyma]|uniref:DUF6594 domain-containing protein n=1 Tax=Dactylonectria macrodidyma TaxID=307937 RepID=A0A9P9E511_9HYPO|nr:hypothetical protein EDB81DRAFT_905875 [Dactylonectria macrodidyma]